VALWYIDGFAGPGEYTNYSQGSPVAALSVAADAIAKSGARWVANGIHCVFIEADAARFEHLERTLSNLPPSTGVHRHLTPGTFVNGLAELKQQTSNPFDGAEPVFAFIDPFGPAGLSFSHL
jgi:three-Cys-motif partner protein